MIRAKSYDWIVAHDGTGGDLAYALECKRCGAVQKVATPIILNLWCAMAKQFEKDHRGCREKVEAQP
mgnify:CR=1 FL=1